MINYEEIRKLERLSESTTPIESFLLNLDDQSKLFTFLWIPTNWTYAASNNFQTKYALFGKRPHTRYQNSNVGTLTISRLEFHTPTADRNLNKVKQDLEKLRLPQNDSLSPPKLSWIIAQQTIQPLYLTDLTIEQLDQINGNSTALGISLSFIGADQITF